MGSHFKTDTDQLGQFLRSLGDAQDQLSEARTALAHVRTGQIGTSSLDEACDSFQERWKYGSEQIADQVKKITEGVKATKENYDKVEEAIEKAFTNPTR